MLAYSGERVTGSAARLHPYFPFLSVTVVAQVTLFRPRPGQHLGEWTSGSGSGVAARVRGSCRTACSCAWSKCAAL